MSKFTIATAKKALAAAYPDIEFTYGKAGRGREAGPCVSWVGGPLPDEIREAAGAPLYRGYNSAPYHFVRQPTQEERDEMHRQWDEQRRAAVAAEPARRAAAKASGIEKRKATHEAKKARLAKLAETFPGVDFSVSQDVIYWTNGPERSEVVTASGVAPWQTHRVVTPDFLASEALRIKAKVHACRLAKRLAYSKVRAIRVAMGIERRRYAALPHLPRMERNPRQFVLPLDFPFWDKPPVYLSRVF